ncbi:MAG: CoA-binding protein [Azospira oryzae]|jgi:predicted CoA-binding protein|nr:MAG: CoA-binding protein [Azospira oryzae]
MNTVIIGATTNTERYAYRAAEMLTKYGHEVFPLGVKKGSVFGKEIQNIHTLPALEEVDTVTLYINPQKQSEWYDYIIGLKPRRIIFNPGTENPELEKKAEEQGIEVLEACTLVMLGTNQY